MAFYRNREFKKAIKDLYTSLDNHPFETYEADIYYHLGISYANLEMYDKSLPPLCKAIELSYNEPCYIHERAKSYLLTDQFKKASDDYTEVIVSLNHIESLQGNFDFIYVLCKPGPKYKMLFFSMIATDEFTCTILPTMVPWDKIWEYDFGRHIKITR